MVNLTQVARTREWGTNPGYQGSAPSEVQPVYRFMAVLVSLRLTKSTTFLASTSRNKVAKMVIDKILSGA